MARRNSLLCGVAVLSAAGAGAPAFAQESVAPAAPAGAPVALAAAQGEAPSSAAPVAAPAASSAAEQLGDIVVTARRRDESLQSVPISITALSGDQLAQKGVAQVSDIRSVTPSLNIAGQTRDSANFYLRGQGPGVVQAGQRNFTSVATYFAEVPTIVSGPGTFFDLGSIQILKGPQGTLFGRNTTGGAVLFEPARPTDQFEGYVEGSVGNHEYYETQFMINAPLAPDQVILRIAGVVSRREGFTKSIFTGQKLDGRNFDAIRGSLLLKPWDNVESLTIVDYRRQHNSASSQILRQVNPGAVLGAGVATPAALAGLLGLPAGTSVTLPTRAGGAVAVGCLSAALPGCPAGGAVGAFRAAYNNGNFADPANGGFAIIAPTSVLLATLAQQQAAGVRTSLQDKLGFSRVLNYGIINRTKVQLGDNITLKNILSFRRSKSNTASDFDGTFLSTIQIENAIGIPQDQKWLQGQQQFTEEFQIQGSLPSAKLSYIVGYYHERQTNGLDQYIPSTQFGANSYVTPGGKDTSDALFGHLEWQPLEWLGFSGGVRQTWDKRLTFSATYNRAGVCTQTDPALSRPGAPVIACPITYNANFKAFTYDGTINIKPKDDVLIYAAYRRGYKSGGFTLPAPAGFQSFKPEFVNDIEVGFKADWDIGVPLRTDFAFFYDKYRNVQVSNSTLVNGTLSTVVQNIGRSTNKGIEFEASLVLVRGLRLGGFFSYLDASSDVDVRTATGALTITAGRQIAFQPRYKYGLNGEWELPIDAGEGAITASANYSWQSRQNTNDLTSRLPFWGSYGLLNARLAWKDSFAKGLDLSLFANNIADKKYILAGYSLSGSIGFEGVLYGEPRMYGATVRYRFGE